jgi:hypothetical protein
MSSLVRLMSNFRIHKTSIAALLNCPTLMGSRNFAFLIAVVYFLIHVLNLKLN